MIIFEALKQYIESDKQHIHEHENYLFHVFPWNNQLLSYIESLRSKNSFYLLGNLFEMAGSIHRFSNDNLDLSNINLLYITSTLTQCASYYYFYASHTELAKSLAMTNANHLKFELSKFNVNGIKNAIFQELLADIEMFIDTSHSELLFQKSIELFEIYGDDELGETHDYYWYICEDELIRTWKNGFNLDIHPTQLKSFDKRIPHKQTILNHIKT